MAIFNSYVSLSEGFLTMKTRDFIKMGLTILHGELFAFPKIFGHQL